MLNINRFQLQNFELNVRSFCKKISSKTWRGWVKIKRKTSDNQLFNIYRVWVMFSVLRSLCVVSHFIHFISCCYKACWLHYLAKAVINSFVFYTIQHSYISFSYNVLVRKYLRCDHVQRRGKVLVNCQFWNIFLYVQNNKFNISTRWVPQNRQPEKAKWMFYFH